MVSKQFLAAGGLLLALTACSPERTPNLGLAKPGFSCNVVTSHATTFGEATARRYALMSLSHEVRDLKGDFIRSGFRGVRQTKKDVVCQPYVLVRPDRGIYRCTAAARICGR